MYTVKTVNKFWFCFSSYCINTVWCCKGWANIRDELFTVWGGRSAQCIAELGPTFMEIYQEREHKTSGSKSKKMHDSCTVSLYSNICTTKSSKHRSIALDRVRHGCPDRQTETVFMNMAWMLGNLRDGQFWPSWIAETDLILPEATLSWRLYDWGYVLLTDKSIFRLPVCDRHVHMWQRQLEDYAKCNIVDRFGGWFVRCL